MSPLPNVPLVGQTSQVLIWYPTALVGCKCQEGQMALVVITQFNNPTLCPKCGKGYAISSVEIKDGMPVVNVAVMLPRQM